MSIKHPGIESIGANETKLQEVHKHWFGLVIVYVQVTVGFGAAVLLLWFITPIIFANTDVATRNTYLSLIVGFAAIFVWVLLVLFTYIYRQNKLIITDKNLTQILQKSLFVRQVSELSMADVEDVSAAKKGFFPTILGYGDMVVETAGATDNFNFDMCPNPDFYGKIVLDAREKFIGKADTE